MKNDPPKESTTTSPILRPSSGGEPLFGAQTNSQRSERASAPTSTSVWPILQPSSDDLSHRSESKTRGYIELNLRCLLQDVSTARLGFDPGRIPFTVKTSVPLALIQPQPGSDYGTLTLRDIINGCQENHRAAFKNSALDERIAVRTEAFQSRVHSGDIALGLAKSPFKPACQTSASPFTPAEAQPEGEKGLVPIGSNRALSPFKPIREKQSSATPPSAFRDVSGTPKKSLNQSLSEPRSSPVDSSRKSLSNVLPDRVVSESRTDSQTDATLQKETNPSKIIASPDLSTPLHTFPVPHLENLNRSHGISRLPQNEVSELPINADRSAGDDKLIDDSKCLRIDRSGADEINLSDEDSVRRKPDDLAPFEELNDGEAKSLSQVSSNTQPSHSLSVAPPLPAPQDPISQAEDSPEPKTSAKNQWSGSQKTSEVSVTQDEDSIEVTDHGQTFQIWAVIISDIPLDPLPMDFRRASETVSSSTLHELLHSASQIDGVLACAIFVKLSNLVQYAEGLINQLNRDFEQEVRQAYEKLAKFTEDLSISNARTITLRTNRGAFSFFGSRDISLAVQHEQLQFPPGVEEKLSSIASNLLAIGESARTGSGGTRL